MHDSQLIKSVDLYSNTSLRFIGPSLDFGPLPALFYFALSAQESLGVDPYNQPVVYLSSLAMRIFSLDIPSHGAHLSSQEALADWVNHFKRGEDILGNFAQQCASIITDLMIKNIVLPERCALAGLSRGAFIATHVAALCKQIQWILGFAPLTQLGYAKEFEQIQEHPLVDKLSMKKLIPLLIGRNVRFYIGNHDERVGTRNCFDFVESLANAMYVERIRSPSVELFIKPSIGFQGHGTSKETFHHGAQWIAEQLGVVDVS